LWRSKKHSINNNLDDQQAISYRNLAFALNYHGHACPPPTTWQVDIYPLHGDKPVAIK